MKIQNKKLLLEMSIDDSKYDFTSSISVALNQAELEIYNLDETIESIQSLKPNCDKLDYTLAASLGALCGIIDIFLVGKPEESSLGNITDKWFADRTTDFARLCKWEDKGNGKNSLSSAIRFLENKFKIPYDQRGAGDAASFIFDLTPTNHHFKSLAHNPSLLGLFFSILDQFTNSSHFISNGELISLADADGKFELKGSNLSSKLFCAFVNWFGHLISDISGSSSSKGRGMGIPSPLWAWTNDIIALKSSLKIPVSQFDNSINELAVNIYKEGYDARFQSAQAFPVFINEMLVRFIYSIRRLIKYYAETDKETQSFSLMWKKCEPFSNPTVKRMLTVAHGTFCIVDIGGAAARGIVTGSGSFNTIEFFLRFNIVGVGRFSISLYGEVKREIGVQKAKEQIIFARKEKLVVENYIEGLKLLSQLYDDKNLLNFITDFKSSEMYIQAFEKSVMLATKRNVLNQQILKNKSDIDSYFLGGKKGD